VDAVRLLSGPQLGIVEWNGYGAVARLHVVTDMPAPARMRTAEEVFGTAFAEEEAFQAALD
jgi:hypothetical protein